MTDIVQFIARQAILHGRMSSPLGRSAVFCSLRYKFDIGCLLNLKFNHCNVVGNHYISTRSSELSTKVAVRIKGHVERRPYSLCIGLFDIDEIATAIMLCFLSLSSLRISVSLFLCFTLCSTFCSIK